MQTPTIGGHELEANRALPDNMYILLASSETNKRVCHVFANHASSTHSCIKQLYYVRMQRVWQDEPSSTNNAQYTRHVP